MKLWHGILLITLILVLPLTGCGGSSEDTDLQNYLIEVTLLIEEIRDMESDVVNTIENAGPFGPKDIAQELVAANAKYDDLLSRFEAIECPKDAMKLREYTIDIINYGKQVMGELINYVNTLDTSHMDRAESYVADAEELRLQASDEWDRLTDIAGEEGGVSILQIFLWILGFGVAVTIAMFVLELTLGAGFGIIAGITVAIGIIVGKIKGGDRRREKGKVRQLTYDSVPPRSQEEEEKRNVWEIYRKEWETASPKKRAELNKRMLRWQELMKNGWTASQAYMRVMEEESDGNS